MNFSRCECKHFFVQVQTISIAPIQKLEMDTNFNYPLTRHIVILGKKYSSGKAITENFTFFLTVYHPLHGVSNPTLFDH